jgi:hypothetical protein
VDSNRLSKFTMIESTQYLTVMLKDHEFLHIAMLSILKETRSLSRVYVNKQTMQQQQQTNRDTFFFFFPPSFSSHHICI